MKTQDTKTLERRRKVVQARLLRTVDELDARAHRVQNEVKHLGAQAKAIVTTARTRAVPTIAGAAAVLTLFGLSAWAFGVAIGRRRHHTLTDRLAEKVRELNLAPRPSFLRLAAEKVALTFVTFAATEAAKRASVEAADLARSGLLLPERTT
jgi:hypothetical protein